MGTVSKITKKSPRENANMCLKLLKMAETLYQYADTPEKVKKVDEELEEIRKMTKEVCDAADRIDDFKKS